MTLYYLSTSLVWADILRKAGIEEDVEVAVVVLSRRCRNRM